MAAAGRTATAAMGVIHRIHHDTAHRRAHAAPALAGLPEQGLAIQTGLPMVARHSPGGVDTRLAGLQPQGGVGPLALQAAAERPPSVQSGHPSRASARCCRYGTNRNVAQRKGFPA